MPRAEQYRLVAPARVVFRSLFSALFPSDCRLCDTPLTDISRLPVCRECIASVQPSRGPQCVLCGDRLTGAQLAVGEECCRACRDFPPEFEQAVSFGEYEAGLRGLIHLLKYEGVRPVAGVLGGMLAQSVAELLPAARNFAPVLVPVPLHAIKQKERGFNQSELIARAAVHHLQHGRLAGRLELVSGVLVRRRMTLSQVGLTRAERIKNVQGAFTVGDAGRIRGRVVIVVDDVMTTGTTLSECSRVLKRAGAEKVFAAAVARAFHPVELPAEDTEDTVETEEGSEAVLSAASV